MYMSNDEFLSNFCMDRLCVMQLNSLVKDDEVFLKVLGKVGRRASMLHVMVLLKFLGSYGNAAAMQKIGHMMGISKVSVKHCLPQKAGPSQSSSANATNNLLKQLGWMKFWHSGLLHLSKCSSFLRNFA